MRQENIDLPLTGSCLCGGISFKLHGSLRPVSNCHCTQCQKTHGNFAAYTKSNINDLKFDKKDTLNWYSSSSEAKRGFCSTCGSSVFWDDTSDPNNICISAGVLDRPTGLKTTQNIFCEDKSDYYNLDPNLEAFPRDP